MVLGLINVLMVVVGVENRSVMPTNASASSAQLVLLCIVIRIGDDENRLSSAVKATQGRPVRPAYQPTPYEILKHE